MSKNRTKIFSLILVLAMLASLLPMITVGASAATAGISNEGGWFESAYAEWTPVSGATGYNAYIAKANSTSWEKIDDALIRKNNDVYRVDAVGLKEGQYKIKTE